MSIQQSLLDGSENPDSAAPMISKYQNIESDNSQDLYSNGFLRLCIVEAKIKTSATKITNNIDAYVTFDYNDTELKTK